MLNLIQSSPEDKDILLRVETEQSRDQWVKKLTKASLDFMTTKKKMDREKQEQCKDVLYTVGNVFSHGSVYNLLKKVEDVYVTTLNTINKEQGHVCKGEVCFDRKIYFSNYIT